MTHLEELSIIIQGSLYRVGLDREVQVSRMFVLYLKRKRGGYVWRVDQRTFKLVRERFSLH